MGIEKGACVWCGYDPCKCGTKIGTGKRSEKPGPKNVPKEDKKK
jgi:hypothetical protein